MEEGGEGGRRQGFEVHRAGGYGALEAGVHALQHTLHGASLEDTPSRLGTQGPQGARGCWGEVDERRAPGLQAAGCPRVRLGMDV